MNYCFDYTVLIIVHVSQMTHGCYNSMYKKQITSFTTTHTKSL